MTAYLVGALLGVLMVLCGAFLTTGSKPKHVWSPLLLLGAWVGGALGAAFALAGSASGLYLALLAGSAVAAKKGARAAPVGIAIGFMLGIWIDSTLVCLAIAIIAGRAVDNALAPQHEGNLAAVHIGLGCAIAACALIALPVASAGTVWLATQALITALLMTIGWKLLQSGLTGAHRRHQWVPSLIAATLAVMASAVSQPSPQFDFVPDAVDAFQLRLALAAALATLIIADILYARRVSLFWMTAGGLTIAATVLSDESARLIPLFAIATMQLVLHPPNTGEAAKTVGEGTIKR